jgi:hypothetical protein
MGDLFKDAENTMAFAKVGILGFAGSGKTRTATEIAIGLYKAIKSTKPIGFMDTETGADFVLPIFQKHGIKLQVSKTRAFKDLAEGLQIAPQLFDILIIDSVSHYWVDIVESYRKKKNVTRLAFQDWAILKPAWNNQFATPFVTSALHIIVCGRAGFEYDYFEGDDGKMELYKTGIKMKAEGEFGFEPSLLLEMERIKNPEATEEYREAKTRDGKMKAAKKMATGREFVRKATILKDRADILDGKVFYNPTYEDFSPHWQAINIGGEHKPLEAGDSEEMFDKEGRDSWAIEKEQRKIFCEEIQGELVAAYPGQSVEEKKKKTNIVFEIFNTRSWTAVENLNSKVLKEGLSKIRAIIFSQEYKTDQQEQPKETLPSNKKIKYRCKNGHEFDEPSMRGEGEDLFGCCPECGDANLIKF